MHPDNTLVTLIANLHNSDDAVRGAAWQGAARFGSLAVQPLAESMTHPDFEIARAAKRALWKIVRHAARPRARKERRAVQAELVSLLESSPNTVRSEAAWMLSEIGDDRAVAKLARLLGEVQVREAARCALERMPGIKAVRALEQAMKSAPDDFRPALASSLRVRGVRVAGYANPSIKPARTTTVRPK